MKSANQLWSNAKDLPPPELSLDEIVARAERLRKKLRWANAREYLAGAFVVVTFVMLAATSKNLPSVSRIGAALIACGAVFVVTYLALRGAAGEVAHDATTVVCYRNELERRRALLAAVPKWYVAPFWPGTVLFFAGMILANPDNGAVIRAVAFSAVFAIAVNVFVVWINLRGARKLAAEIASLDALSSERT